MATNTQLQAWDYDIPKNWQPTTDYEWRWFLERKINYDDFNGLDMGKVKEMINEINIDEGKKLMISAYFKHYGKQ